ncbi:dTDP-4-dehydrorhamnose reductase [Roseomonas sp. OT10]|uniref:dTDP-4-dehydrorhamnose reductase n=1 Tax=Roseomonas cutis TaxID=2897332 RepID=UPI001E4A34D2|nr:dTDP-4-dehydrorhamnose reductase [Roseomonas sp. OT10]UFN50702.1 dTDP-4-dehydrorhamnose reductase [Roseomonas sp. OT10]
MRVLVAGKVGQLGLALRTRLAEAGHDVTALGRPELDLTRPETIRAAVKVLQPEVVINAAAYTAVDRAEDEPEAAMAVNRDGARLLAAAAQGAGAPFVQLSTDYVFDGTKGAPYTEEDATNPTGAYGASKLAGEEAALKANPRTLVLRTAWVCSADGNNFVRTMLRLGRERPELRIVADQQGAPTFADDLAAAIAAMLPRLHASPEGDPAFGVFHLTGAPYTSWYGFAAAIFGGAGARALPSPVLHPITTAEYPTKARRPADSRLDCTRIAAIHGIAQPDWRPALERCLDRLIGSKEKV